MNEVSEDFERTDRDSGVKLKSYPILKSISEPHKITAAAGIAFEMRQIYIIAGMVVFPMVLYQFILQHFMSLTFGQGAALMGPIVVLAILMAWVKYDGREFAWWFWKRTVGSLKEDRLVWRSRDPMNIQELRDSVQAYIPAEKIYWDMLKNTTGVYTLVLEVDPVSLSLASTEDKQRVHDQLAQVYDRIDFPFVEVSGAKPGNVSRYIDRTRDDIEREIISGHDAPEESVSALTLKQERFLEYGSNHLEWLDRLVSEHNVYDRTAYIVLPYKPSSTYAESIQALQEVADIARKLLGKPLGRFLPFLRGPSAKEAGVLQRMAEKAYAVLCERAAVFAAAYEPIGIDVRVLEGTEQLNVIREMAGGGDLSHSAGASKPPPQEDDVELFSPVTLTDADGYGELPPERLDRVLARVEENRKAAPPAVGIGELHIDDEIAPEAIKVFDSYLKVNDTYQATMFVHDLPDQVHFGILDRFLRMEGKVRTLKYVNPIDKDKADSLLSKKISELIAAQSGTGGDNVRDEKRREIALGSAQKAYDKVLMDEESYHELSIVVHCEADTLEELRSLVEQVRTKLKGARARSKLARQEMLEGYMSSQLFGLNSLTRRHCTKGILTNPLSCLFTFGSFKLEHEDGVLYGIDQDSHSMVIFDHKVLPNQHMILFGKPGMGKSFAVKVMATRKRLKGESVILVDPEGNTGYDRAAKAVGGEYVVLGLGSPHKINPLDIRTDYMNLTVLAGADDTEDQEDATNRAKSGAFYGKIQKLVDLVNLMAAKDEDLSTNLSAAVQGKLERLFVATYNDFGITQDPATHTNTPPTMTDFFERLAVAAETDPDLELLRAELYQWEQGSLREVFDGQTNVDLDSPFLVLQISAANEGKGKAPIMYAMLDYLSGRLSNPEEAITCYIDEQWSLLKFKLAVELMNELWRVGRVRNTSMVGITQDILEFVSSEKSETIIRLSSTKMLLGQNRKTIDAISRYIELSQEQKTRIANFTKGQALLCVDEDKQVPLQIVASELEKRIFNTDPNLEKKYREQERQEKPELEAATQGTQKTLGDGNGQGDPRALPAGVSGNGDIDRDGHLKGEDLPEDTAERPLAVHNAHLGGATSQGPNQPNQTSIRKEMLEDLGIDEDRQGPNQGPNQIPNQIPNAPAAAVGDGAAYVGGSDSGGSALQNGQPRDRTSQELWAARYYDPDAKAVPIDPIAHAKDRGQHVENGAPEASRQDQDAPGPSHASDHDNTSTTSSTTSSSTRSISTELVKAGAGSMPMSAAAVAPVFAVTGDSSPIVAFNLAGVLAMSGHDRGVKVLLVDAEGSISEKHFGGSLSYDAGTALADHLIHEPESGLRALVHPSPEALHRQEVGGGPLSRNAREGFDLIIAIVGDGEHRSAYGRDWLLEADGVIAAGSTGDGLARNVAESEALRGSNGTLVAPLGRPTLPGEVADHKVYKLPSAKNATLKAAYETGDFAAATDSHAARSFVGLAAEVLGLCQSASGVGTADPEPAGEQEKQGETQKREKAVSAG